MKKLFLPVAIMAASLPAWAKQTDVEQVVVSGTRSEQPSVQIPASIKVITAEDIKLSGASNIVHVLNAQAGIQIKDLIGNGGRAASVSMRGFGENSVNNVLILVDGRKLNNPSLASPDLASIAIKDVERVEIIQGSAGTLYGDQATGGVINVITKKPDGISAFVEAGRGTDDLEVYRGAVSQGFDNGVSYRLSAEKKLADNYRDNNEANYSNVLANVAYEQGRFRVFAEWLNVDDDLNLAGSLNSLSIRDDRRQASTPDQYTNQDTDSSRVGGHFDLSESWAVAAEYSDRETESKGFSWGSEWQSTITVESFNPRLLGEVATNAGAVLVTVGADLQESEYESTQTFTDSNQDISDIYGQVVVPVIENLKITVGARYSELDETENNSGVSNDDSVNVYQVGAAYQLSKTARVFIRRDEGFRWSTIDENGYTALPAGEILKPQESESWELGIESDFDAVTLSVVLYDMDLDNEIYYDPTAGLYGANGNLEESNRKGLVADSQWQLNEQLKLQLNYSYVDAEVNAGLYKGNTVPFVAKETANLVVSYQLSDHWSAYADAQYTGSRYLASDDSNSGDELGGYTVYNANIRWDNDDLYVNLRANNLTGKKFDGFASIYDYAYPAAEELYEVTVGYNF